MILEITQDNLLTVLEEKNITVLQFSAPWCGPCKTLSPIIEELSNENASNENINICKVNIDENSDIAIKYEIRSIPTILFLKNGDVVDRIIGAKPKSLLQSKINELLSY